VLFFAITRLDDLIVVLAQRCLVFERLAEEVVDMQARRVERMD
jgi:hypothetical protein